MYCDERRDVVVRPPRFGEFADLDALITDDGLSDTTSDDLSAGRTGAGSRMTIHVPPPT